MLVKIFGSLSDLLLPAVSSDLFASMRYTTLAPLSQQLQGKLPLINCHCCSTNSNNNNSHPENNAVPAFVFFGDFRQHLLQVHNLRLPLNPFHYELPVRVIVIGGLGGTGKSALMTCVLAYLRNKLGLDQHITRNTFTGQTKQGKRILFPYFLVSYPSPVFIVGDYERLEAARTQGLDGTSYGVGHLILHFIQQTYQQQQHSNRNSSQPLFTVLLEGTRVFTQNWITTLSELPILQHALNLILVHLHTSDQQTAIVRAEERRKATAKPGQVIKPLGSIITTWTSQIRNVMELPLSPTFADKLDMLSDTMEQQHSNTKQIVSLLFSPDSKVYCDKHTPFLTL